MPVARLARISDLQAMLQLFAASEVSPAVDSFERAGAIWRATIEADSIAVFVVEVGEAIVATAMLITAPNLLRGGRRHGFLENVVTHPDHRGHGCGRTVVTAALDHAWRVDCHHVLMQSGRSDPRVHAFYESLGFRPDLRIGYAAKRPPDHE